ncbi:MAG: GFA family protein [bacterium]
MSKTKHSGSCLCGTVTFEVEGAFEKFFLCHCNRCRKSTGSAHAANLFSNDASLVWLSGEDQIRSFRVPETRHVRAFCGQCGSVLPQGGSQRVMVPAGTLDTEFTMAPTAHIFMSDKAAWDHDLEKVERHDRYA